MSIDKLTEKLTELATKLEGPGFEASKEAAKTEAYSTLTAGGLAAVFAVVLTFGCMWLWRRKTDYDDDVFKFTGLIFSALGAAVAWSIALWSVLDPWVWTTIARPELWIAKKVLGL